jgi:hypothetical protein
VVGDLSSHKTVIKSYDIFAALYFINLNNSRNIIIRPMKKIFIGIATFVAAVLIFGLTSCEKETDNAQVTLQQATVKGKVEAWLDLNATSIQPAPTGTKIYASVKASDLVNGSNSNTGLVRYETTIAADGTYSFTINVNEYKAATVTISGDDFRYSQKQDATNTISKIYTLGSSSISVISAQTKILDLAYDAN